jgi:hypothetical protein
MKKYLEKVALIKADYEYEEGKLQPTPTGQPQLGTPWSCLPLIFWRRKIEKITKIYKKDLEKK